MGLFAHWIIVCVLDDAMNDGPANKKGPKIFTPIRPFFIQLLLAVVVVVGGDVVSDFLL